MQVNVLILSLAKNGQFAPLAETIVLILLISYMLVITLIGWISVSQFDFKFGNFQARS